MTSSNTSNYTFLKNIKPDLYKLCLEMEKDLLITPISMLAYSTRFLEYVLYDIAKRNGYKVNRDIGFVKNIYEVVNSGYIDNNLGDLLIKAYVYRNSSIHDTDVINAMKKDKKTALELNRRLFDIADIHYGNSVNTYVEPISDEPQMELNHVVKQEKLFDSCIICGKSSTSSSNFCQGCDNLLNYREVLSHIISEKGKDAFFTSSDIKYSYKSKMIEDLTSLGIIEKVGNRYHFLADNLDIYFIETDNFMEIDKFLADFKTGNIRNPFEYEICGFKHYPFYNVSEIVIAAYVDEVNESLKNGKSLKNSIKHVCIEESELKSWYENKKSEFVGGYKDKKFIELNELLIINFIKSIENDNPQNISESTIDFWSKYFDGFEDEYARKISEYRLKAVIDLLKKNYGKEYILNRLDIDEKDLNQYLKMHEALAKEYADEINERKKLILGYANDLSLNESVEKAKLTMDDIIADRDEFLSGNENEFYQNLSKILAKRYLDCRKNGLGTDEIISELGVEKSEIEFWMGDERFGDFQNDYSKIRLELFKKSTAEKKSKKEILDELEISEDELNEYVELGKQGIAEYVEYYDYFQNDYFPDLIESFFNEFRQQSSLNEALKHSELTKEDLDKYLQSNKDFEDKFIEIKIDKIASVLIDKKKLPTKFYGRLDITKSQFRQWEDKINEKLQEKQLELITDEISNGEIVYNASKNVNCDYEMVFDWIFKGTIDDNEYSDLACNYWEEHIDLINDGNSEIREKNPEIAIRNNLNPKLLKYDFDYWKKWGLIDKKNIELTQDDVKLILEKNGDI